MKELFMVLIFFLVSCADKNNYRTLTQEEHSIIVEKGTEERFSGQYNDHYEKGIYACKRCDLSLFSSDDKFDSKSGWPSFDDSLKDHVVQKEPGKIYTEITCKRCSGHIGHIKRGEKFTEKDARFCANSLALKFKPE